MSAITKSSKQNKFAGHQEICHDVNYKFLVMMFVNLSLLMTLVIDQNVVKINSVETNLHKM